jgi:hypothetical protein
VINRPLVHHFESASRGYYLRPAQEAEDRAALRYLEGKWGCDLRADPFYNPNLALDRENYTLAYPPRVPAERALRFAFARGLRLPDSGELTAATQWLSGAAMPPRHWFAPRYPRLLRGDL